MTRALPLVLWSIAAMAVAGAALGFQPPATRAELVKMMPANLWDRSHVAWVDDVAVVLQPYCYDPADKQRLLEEFRPDLLDWYCGAGMNSGRFMWMRGVRCSFAEEYEYQEALQFPNHLTERLFMDNGVTRKLDGRPARFSGRYHNAYFMCHNAPKWHEMVVQGLTRVAAYGDSVTQDNIGVPLNKGQGNFCDWCNRRFLDWLQRRYGAEKMRRWMTQAGVADPAAFNVRGYINALRRRGVRNDQVIWKPLIHEYIRFQYMSHIAAWLDAATAAKREAAAQGLPIPALYGNQWGAWGHLPYATALSQYVDVVWIEGGCTQPPFSGSEHALAPLFYKIGRAAGGFRRPVWTIEYPERDYPTSKMATAAVLSDAFASGGFMVGLWAMRHLDGPRYEINRLYWNFADDNRALFIHRQQLANVALVYSLPTWMWRRFSSLSCDVPQADYAAFARILEDAHIPFECLIFGHPDIYDDTAQLDRLERYQAVVLLGADCVSDRQVEALVRYARAGGTVVVIPPFAERDEEGRRRTTPVAPPAFREPPASQLASRRLIAGGYGAGRVLWLARELIADWKAPGERRAGAFEQCQAALRGVIGRHIWLETDAPPIVWTEPWLCGLGRLVAVHLVNYAIDLKADRAKDPGPFSLTIRLPDGVGADEAWLLEPGRRPRRLSMQRQGSRVRLAVPSMGQYAVVAVGARGALAAANEYMLLRKLIRRLEVALRCRDILRTEARPDDPPTAEAPQIVQRLWQRAQDVENAITAGRFATASRAARSQVADARRLLDRAVAENLRLDGRILASHLALDADVKLDFGEGPAAPGWQKLTSRDRWAKGRPYGWAPGAELTTTGGQWPDALHGDVAKGTRAATLYIAAPDGLYECTVIVPRSRTFATEVRSGGALLLPASGGHPGTFGVRRFLAEARDGKLELTFGGGPTGPEFSASHAWAICGLALSRIGRKPPKAGTADPYAGYVRHWLVVGSDNAAGCGKLADLARRYRKPERTFSPARRITVPRAVAEVNVASALHAVGGQVARLRFYLELARPRRVVLHFGATGRALVWLVGPRGARLVIRDWKASGLSPDEYVAALDLPAGLSTFEVATGCCFGTDWRVAAKITDERGRPAGVVLPGPAGAAAVPAAMLPRVELLLPESLELGETARGALLVQAPGTATVAARLTVGAVPPACRAAADSREVAPLPPDGFAEIPIGLALEHTTDADRAVVTAEVIASGETRGLRAAGLVTLVQPKLQLLVSAEEPARRVVADFGQATRPWEMASRGVAASVSLDRKTYKSPPAAVRLDMTDNGNGREDYPNLGIAFRPPQNWLAFEHLELWARCESALAERQKRHLCVELVDRWGKPHDFHFYLPTGEWQKVSVDLTRVPRGAVRALRLFVYEMDSRRAEYTWWFDDVTLVNDDPLQLSANEAVARALIVNPLSRSVSGKLQVRLPPGWKHRPAGVVPVQVAAGSSAVAEFVVGWPADAAGKLAELAATLQTAWGPIVARATFQPLPTLHAPRTSSPPSIDGRLDDACWKTAAWVGRFLRNTDCRPVSADTRAAVCWDEQNLYIAFVCREPYMDRIVARERHRDGRVWMDDCVEVYIDADADRQAGDYDHYVVNTLGVLRDERGGDPRWNSSARVAARRGDGQWFVEIAIPWRDYGGPPRAPWAINLHRTRQPKPGLPEPEYGCWSCTRGPFDNPAAFGVLVFGSSP